MIDRERALPVTKQAAALGIGRSSVYYLPRTVPAADLALSAGWTSFIWSFLSPARMLRGLLAARGSKTGRRHVRTPMRRMGIEALYRRPRTAKSEP